MLRAEVDLVPEVKIKDIPTFFDNVYRPADLPICGSVNMWMCIKDGGDARRRCTRRYGRFT